MKYVPTLAFLLAIPIEGALADAVPPPGQMSSVEGCTYTGQGTSSANWDAYEPQTSTPATGTCHVYTYSFNPDSGLWDTTSQTLEGTTYESCEAAVGDNCDDIADLPLPPGYVTIDRGGPDEQVIYDRELDLHIRREYEWRLNNPVPPEWPYDTWL